MRVTVLSIGDELLCGEVVDTNAALIGGELYRLGLKVQMQLTVGDAEDDIVEAIQSLAARSDAVIVTGGLGPTGDDVTAAAAARATGLHLVLNHEALAHVKRVAGKLGGEIHPANDRQALIPQGAHLIPNPGGTACGFYLDLNDCSLFFMPGVPVEMERMFRETVLPCLAKRRGAGTVLKTRILKVFGLSEAEVDARLTGVISAENGVTVAFGVEFPEIHLKLRAEGEDEASVQEALLSAGEKARQHLQGCVFGENCDTIDSVVAQQFLRSGSTVALAESCTGGLLAKRITDLPGSSTYFVEGAVTYSDAAKIRMLGVPARVIMEYGAVSAETALAMASGIRHNSGSDLGLAITGIAGPGGGSEAKPVGTVFLALADATGCDAREYHFSGSRDEIRTITAFTALDWLRRYLVAA